MTQGVFYDVSSWPTYPELVEVKELVQVELTEPIQECSDSLLSRRKDPMDEKEDQKLE